MDSANKPFSEKIRERTPLPRKFWRIALVALPLVLYLVVALVVPVAMDGTYCFSTASDAGANIPCEQTNITQAAENTTHADKRRSGKTPNKGELQPGIDWDALLQEEASRGGMDSAAAAALAAQQAFEEELRRQGLDKDGNPTPENPAPDNTKSENKECEGSTPHTPPHSTHPANKENLSEALRNALLPSTEPETDTTTDGTAENAAAITPFTAEFLQALFALVTDNLVSVEATQPIQHNGDTATATLGLILFGDVPVETDLQLTFVWSDGRWKLAQSMSCTLVESMGITCPDWLRELNKRTAAGQMANDATGKDAAHKECACKNKNPADATKPKTGIKSVTTKPNSQPKTLLDAVEIAKKLRANGIQKILNSVRTGTTKLHVGTIQDALRLFHPQEYPL